MGLQHIVVIQCISIHALREEGDFFNAIFHPPQRAISIHALREEGDVIRAPLPPKLVDFYPRPPRGGRPQPPRSSRSSARNFYPRPPRGGRRGLEKVASDLSNFYPRPPRGGRPFHGCVAERGYHISIHALREEGD